MSKEGSLVTQSNGDVIVVFFRNVALLDESSIQKLYQELLEISDTRYKIKMLINFENVEYLSSAVLGKLVSLHKKVANDKGVLKLCCIKDSILEVFKVTRLDKVLDIQPSQEKAIKSFQSRGFLGFKKG